MSIPLLWLSGIEHIVQSSADIDPGNWSNIPENNTRGEVWRGEEGEVCF